MVALAGLLAGGRRVAEWVLTEERDVRGNDAPSLGKSNPCLTLSAMEGVAVDFPGELQCDAAEVTAKCNYVESIYGAREVHFRSPFAEGGDFLKTVQVFRSSKAQRMPGVPEHGGQRVGVVGDECGFVPRVERGQFGDNFGIVDDHVRRAFSPAGSVSASRR